MMTEKGEEEEEGGEEGGEERGNPLVEVATAKKWEKGKPLHHDRGSSTRIYGSSSGHHGPRRWIGERQQKTTAWWTLPLRQLPPKLT